jgi:hypothetical protein
MKTKDSTPEDQPLSAETPRRSPEVDVSLVRLFAKLSVEERIDYLSRQVRAIEELRRGLQR